MQDNSVPKYFLFVTSNEILILINQYYLLDIHVGFGSHMYTCRVRTMGCLEWKIQVGSGKKFQQWMNTGWRKQGSTEENGRKRILGAHWSYSILDQGWSSWKNIESLHQNLNIFKNSSSCVKTLCFNFLRAELDREMYECGGNMEKQCYKELLGCLKVAWPRGGRAGSGIMVDLHLSFWSIGWSSDLKLYSRDLTLSHLVKDEHLHTTDICKKRQESVKPKGENEKDTQTQQTRPSTTWTITQEGCWRRWWLGTVLKLSFWLEDERHVRCKYNS